ncbi:hypothetical protein [Geodermatophilus sp. SYSU D00710]
MTTPQHRSLDVPRWTPGPGDWLVDVEPTGDDRTRHGDRAVEDGDRACGDP